MSIPVDVNGALNAAPLPQLPPGYSVTDMDLWAASMRHAHLPVCLHCLRLRSFMTRAPVRCNDAYGHLASLHKLRAGSHLHCWDHRAGVRAWSCCVLLLDYHFCAQVQCMISALSLLLKSKSKQQSKCQETNRLTKEAFQATLIVSLNCA